MKTNLAKLVSKEAVTEALNRFEKNKPDLIPSTKFDIEYNGKYYPPKEVVREAASIMGIKIDDDKHSLGGGDKTNIPLQKLGFTIVSKNEIPSVNLTVLLSQIKKYENALYNTDWLNIKEIYKFSFIHWVENNIDFNAPALEIKEKFELAQQQRFDPSSTTKGVNFLQTIKRYNDEYITLEDIELLKKVAAGKIVFDEHTPQLSSGSYPKASLFLSFFKPDEFIAYDGESLPSYEFFKPENSTAPKRGYTAFKFYQSFYQSIREKLRESTLNISVFKKILNTDTLTTLHWNWITQDFLLYTAKITMITNTLQERYNNFENNRNVENWEWYIDLKKYTEIMQSVKQKAPSLQTYNELNQYYNSLGGEGDFLTRYLFLSYNGLSSIRQQLISLKRREEILYEVQKSPQTLFEILKCTDKGKAYNLVHALIVENRYTVIFRFLRACFPYDFTSIDAPGHFWYMWNKLKREFTPDLDGENQTLANKDVIGKIKYTDVYKAQIFFWEYKDDKDLEQNQPPHISQDMEEEVTSPIPLNQIFYGAPGTGKTYTTKKAAVEIIDSRTYNDSERDLIVSQYNKYIKTGQINFVTFHQSMSYEDFIEGIKPSVPDDTEDGTPTTIEYDVKDGIFKRMAKSAISMHLLPTEEAKLDYSKVDFYKMSLGGKHRLEKHNWGIENNVIFLGWGRDKDFTELKSIKEWTKFKNTFTKNYPELVSDSKFSIQAVYTFLNMKIGDVVIVSKGNKIIDAIGVITSDYYYDDNKGIENYQFRDVKWLATNMNINSDALVSKAISQMTIYKFLKKDINISIIEELLNNKQEVNKSKKFVLIIDEINRGNISSIFGELITLLEEDKRAGILQGRPEALEVELPYSNDKFSVPDNLYIIGTMNTADRSVEALDTALRRRFSFVEMQPDPTKLLLNNEGLITDVEGEINLVTLLTTVNNRIEILIDKDHKIGHSFFINIQTVDELKDVFKNKVIPLLEEYFFGDYGKIGLVLGKSFIQPKSYNGKNKFAEFPYGEGIDVSVFTDKVVYEFTSTESWNTKAFCSIYCVCLQTNLDTCFQKLS